MVDLISHSALLGKLEIVMLGLSRSGETLKRPLL